MTDYCPYCYLYENTQLLVSTAVLLEANESLKDARKVTVPKDRITTITYEVMNPPVGGPAQVHTPADEEIPRVGTENWTVVVIVDNGGNQHTTTINSDDL